MMPCCSMPDGEHSPTCRAAVHQKMAKRRAEDKRIRTAAFKEFDGIVSSSIKGNDLLLGVMTEEARAKIPATYEGRWVFTRIMQPGKLLIGGHDE